MDTFSTRQIYWAEQLEKADGALRMWIDENYRLSWGDSGKLIVENCAKLAQKARLAIQNPLSFPDVERFDAYVRANVEGIYLQINTKLPQWTDVVKDTASDTVAFAKETAKTASTWGAGGIGLGLVIVGAIWLATR